MRRFKSRRSECKEVGGETEGDRPLEKQKQLAATRAAHPRCGQISTTLRSGGRRLAT
jgi:hypothetical protein